jgi:peptide/nickel transport system substrate-binding protein
MNKLLITSVMALALGGTSALAAPSGTFKQAHEIGFGDKSNLDPASKGRVMQILKSL